MRSIRMLSVAILATTGLVAVGVTTEAANAASGDLSVQHSHVMKYEKFSAAGTLSTHVARTVKLQYRNDSGDPWTTKASVTSSGSGFFYFTDVSTSRTRYFRYYAPSTDTLPKIVGNSKKITVISQTGSAYISPFEIFYYCPDSNTNQTVYAVATFYPARAGRPVSLTSPNGANISRNMDAKGHVVLPFNIQKTSGTYSVVVTADAWNGAAAKSASPTSIKVYYFCF